VIEEEKHSYRSEEERKMQFLPPKLKMCFTYKYRSEYALIKIEEEHK
jgi:hypothetical protein